MALCLVRFFPAPRGHHRPGRQKAGARQESGGKHNGASHWPAVLRGSCPLRAGRFRPGCCRGSPDIGIFLFCPARSSFSSSRHLLLREHCVFYPSNAPPIAAEEHGGFFPRSLPVRSSPRGFPVRSSPLPAHHSPIPVFPFLRHRYIGRDAFARQCDKVPVPLSHLCHRPQRAERLIWMAAAISGLFMV